MSLAKLKKELKEYSKEQVADLVLDLYQKVPKAKDYLDMFVAFNIEALAEKYKKQIKRYCTPNFDFHIKDTEARKLIREIRKMEIDELTVKLELYYCACCIDVIDKYGSDISSAFCNALEDMFQSAMKTIRKNVWKETYADELSKFRGIGNNYGFFYY